MNTIPHNEKQCLACLRDIDSRAVLCAHCGTQQNWRRHLPLGESSLALILSSIALAAALIPDPRSVIKEFSDHLSGTNFAISAVLVDINIDQISVLVTNDQNSEAAINGVTCLMNIPLDTGYEITQFLRRRSEGLIEYDPLTVSNTMGLIQIAYEQTIPVLVPKYDTAIITIPMLVISAPLGNREYYEPDEEVRNFCMIIGVNFEDEIASGLITIKPQQLYSIDLLELLERAEYSSGDEDVREADIMTVKEAREKNKSMDE